MHWALKGFPDFSCILQSYFGIFIQIQIYFHQKFSFKIWLNNKLFWSSTEKLSIHVIFGEYFSTNQGSVVILTNFSTNQSSVYQRLLAQLSSHSQYQNSLQYGCFFEKFNQEKSFENTFVGIRSELIWVLSEIFYKIKLFLSKKKTFLWF